MKRFTLILIIISGLCINLYSQNAYKFFEKKNQKLVYSKEYLSKIIEKESICKNWLSQEFNVPISEIKGDNNSIKFINSIIVNKKRLGQIFKAGNINYKFELLTDSQNFRITIQNIKFNAEGTKDTILLENMVTEVEKKEQKDYNFITEQIVIHFDTLLKSFENYYKNSSIPNLNENRETANPQKAYFRVNMSYGLSNRIARLPFDLNESEINYYNKLRLSNGFLASGIFFTKSSLGLGISFYHTYASNSESLKKTITTDLIAPTICYSFSLAQDYIHIIPSVFLGYMKYNEFRTQDIYFYIGNGTTPNQTTINTSGSTIGFGFSLSSEILIKIKKRRPFSFLISGSLIQGELSDVKSNPSYISVTTVKNLGRLEFNIGISYNISKITD